DPHMRILMAEVRPERQELLTTELAVRPVVRLHPLLPGFRPDRMRRRAEREDVHQHRLVISTPVETQKAAFRAPAMRQHRRTVLRPLPIDAPIDLLGEIPDLPF